jgi:hypothetical protein
MRWGELPADLQEAGRGLLYQFGVGLGMLATVRPDGGPRVHPMCPIIHDGDLYALIEHGPKQRDLIRDGRYALHCFPPATNEDAFYCTGTATEVDDPASVEAAFWAERQVDGPPPDVERRSKTFVLDVETVLLTRTTGHGDWHPQHTVWHAQDSSS